MISYFKYAGKMNRGLMSVVSYCHLVGDRSLSEEEEKLVFTLGWCMEMVSFSEGPSSYTVNDESLA